MKVMRASQHLDNDVATFRHEGGVAQIPLIAEGTHKDASLTDEFATNDYSSRDGEESDDERDDTEDSTMEELVLHLAGDEDGTVEVSEKEISLALGHLRKIEAAFIRSTIFDGGSVVAWMLENLSPADVPYRHSLELKYYRLIRFWCGECPEATLK